MKSSIRWRLVMMYVLLVVIVMMVSGTMIITMIRSTEMEQTKQEIVSYVDIFIELLELEEKATVEELDLALESYFAQEQSSGINISLIEGKKIFILDKNARVKYSRGDAEKGRPFSSFMVQSALVDSEVYDTFDKDRKFSKDGTLYLGYAENIKIDGKVIYVIYVLGDTSDIDDNIQNIIMIILMAVGVALVISAILGFVFSDFLTKPITALTMKARDMQRGGRLDQPMKVYANDEIGQLTKNFNKMATSLNDTLNEVTSEKNKLEIVFRHMTDGILVFDKIGMMIHSNPASISMLRIEKQISYQEVFKPYLDVSYRELKELVRDETISHIVAVEGKYFSVYFAKFLDQYNEAVGIICVIQDVTEHKKLEEMQKEFVANVSHELRTPLTTIKSYAETLLEGALDDRETAERFLGVINHEGDRMTALVQDLLELSKLDNSQIQFSMNDINLEHIVADSVDKYIIHSDKKTPEHDVSPS